jgi:hypothetical protein
MGDSEQVLDDSLQVEWAKVRARKQHWEEEALLIQEEMCKAVRFFGWKAQWWLSQACCRTEGNPSIIHGVAAYAEKQAHLCKCLAQSCITAWLPVLKGSGVISDWEAYYPFMPTTTDVSSETFTDDDDNGGGGEEIYESGNERGEYSEGNNNIGIDLFEVED